MKAIPISRERARHMGLWVMERHTVCRKCDRYTQTTRERVCQRCHNLVVALTLALSRAS